MCAIEVSLLPQFLVLNTLIRLSSKKARNRINEVSGHTSPLNLHNPFSRRALYNRRGCFLPFHFSQVTMRNRNLRKFWIIGSSAHVQVLWNGSAHLEHTGGVNSLPLGPYILVKQLCGKHYRVWRAPPAEFYPVAGRQCTVRCIKWSQPESLPWPSLTGSSPWWDCTQQSTAGVR